MEVATIVIVATLTGIRNHNHLIAQIGQTVNAEIGVVAAVIVLSVTKTTTHLIRSSVVAKTHLVILTRSQNTRLIP